MTEDTAGRLAPGAIAEQLFGLAPDRDERAAQLCQEALLTLACNGYEDIAEAGFVQPLKRTNFALRSLALGVNFLDGHDDNRAFEDTTPQKYGELLARGATVRGSANLDLARDALQGLIDPETRNSQPGGWLLYPFHESLLWYDARRQGRGGRWGTRRVYMRGGGVTIARLLADSAAGDETRKLGFDAIVGLREALQGPSPLGHIARELERPIEGLTKPGSVEPAENDAWQAGGDPGLRDLAERICRHAEGVVNQGSASAPAKLWQLRSILALDVAINALNRAWRVAKIEPERQYLLLSFAGPPRAENRVRQHSERTLAESRLALQEALLATLAQQIRATADEDGKTEWHEQFITRRGKLEPQIKQLEDPNLTPADIDRVAREIIDAANYDRAIAGFTRLLGTAGLIGGSGAYRFLTATPDMLSALVGALSDRMPMDSTEFFAALRDEWGLVVDQASATNTALIGEIDGADLERNARRAEAQLADSGLALSLSDRTTIVGERAQRTQ